MDKVRRGEREREIERQNDDDVIGIKTYEGQRRE
jgi:hypothetical protein